MATVLRLQRLGTHKRPFYRMVVTDSRNRRDGRYIELVGTYDPMVEPNVIDLKLDRITHWTSLGAKPSEAVASLVKRANEGRGVTHSQLAELRAKDLAARREAAISGAKAVQKAAPAPVAPAAAPAVEE